MPKHMWSRPASDTVLLAVVVLLMAVAVSPLMRADQPCTHDGGLHYYRIVAMRQALGDGLLVSRWAPDLAFGYGYPFFNYRAASSYYLGLGLYVGGLTLPQALNMVYVVSLVGAAIGAYLLGRDLFGRTAGLIAAVAYSYAPYSFIDALVRGNMPESVALALLPFILWSFRRLLLSGRALYLLTSAGMLALLWLSHNISSLLFTPFLVLYLLVIWCARLPDPRSPRGGRDHPAAVVVALALGIGLTAFFWAPAVLEQGDVQLHLSRTTRNNDYHYNFITLSEVLAPPEAADPTLLNPPLRLPVGLPLVALALLGTALALWRWWAGFAQSGESPVGEGQALVIRERWASVAFFALSAIAFVFMATRASLALWENLPLIPFVQFPWRFVGRAVLPLSLLAASLISALHRDAKIAGGEAQRALGLPGLALLIAAAILILAALPFTYPAAGYCPAEPRPDMRDLFAYERSTGLVGVDPEGSYFPVTVRTRPTGSPLEAQYAARLAQSDRAERAPILRFDIDSLPEGASIHQADYAPNRARLEIETPSAVRARYLAFAFPGWQVRVDDSHVDVVPSDPEGLITFDLPAGRHVVEVAWGSTTVRAVATMLSLGALAGLVFVAYRAVRSQLIQGIRGEGAISSAAQDRDGSSTGLGGASQTLEQPVGLLGPSGALCWSQVGLLVIMALLLIGFKLAVVDRTSTPFRHSRLSAEGTLPAVDVPLDARFDDSVRLLGYERSVEHLPTDGSLHLAFYWSADARPSRSYKATAALVGPDGQLWSPKTAFPRRGYADPPPSPAWGPGRYVVDGLDVEPLPGTPPGDYDLLLTVFDRETLAPLNALDEAGRVLGPDLVVGQINLSRPTRSPDPGGVSMQKRLDVDLGWLRLAGVDLDREEAAPGDPMMVTLLWQAQGDRGELPDLRVHLALVDERGEEAQGWELPPVRDDWPTSRWEGGEVWRGQHLMRIPGGLESGTYTWGLALYESDGPERRGVGTPVELGQLRVAAPEREWEAPPMALTLGAELGGQVRLLGANVQPEVGEMVAVRAPETLTVTLVWQARREMEISYRVFLHVLGPEGGVVVQSDGEPVGWTRPTTGWAPGEVVGDERVLQIPAGATPGQYTLVAGLYDPGARERLALPDGTTTVLITPFTVAEP